VSLGDFYMPIKNENYIDSLRKSNGFRIGFYNNYTQTHAYGDTKNSIKEAATFNAHRSFFKTNKITYGIFSKSYPFKDSLLQMTADTIADSKSGSIFFTLRNEAR
jgi:hypothetical protein